jgi:hypothetical protein
MTRGNKEERHQGGEGKKGVRRAWREEDIFNSSLCLFLFH